MNVKLFLLTHPRELLKKSNTGTLVVRVLQEKAQVIVWDRVKPDPNLLELIGKGSVALLYPAVGSEQVSETMDYKNFIIIDGTWQQAQKIYNHSPYLKNLPAVHIAVDEPSAYHLRRNQRTGCLCTAECAIQLLLSSGNIPMADELRLAFNNLIA